ncbi:MAG: hypothetical protein KatS3mg009_3226 [Acidimicrobiia bacterium]|nr:MAG: hypothetical protein KatS3mg009_3226 [Acidimicrobiia bacterium]
MAKPAAGERPVLGLRARGTVAFALLALVLSASLALLTYQIARRYLLDQRESLRAAAVDGERPPRQGGAARPRARTSRRCS